MAFALIKGIFGGSDYYGSKPEIPAAPTTEGILKDVTAANIAVAPEAARLAALTNKFNQENILANLRGVLGTEAVDEIPKAIGAKLAAEIKGQLSPDMLASLRNTTAAQNLSSGTGPDSLFSQARTARDFGLASYDVSNRALGAYESWLEASSRLLSPTLDLTSFFATPALGAGIAGAKYERDYLAALTAAAPDPVKRGQFDSEMAILGMVLSAYGGGAGYTGKVQQPWEGSSGSGSFGSGGSGGKFNFFGLGGGGNSSPSAKQTAFGNNVPEGWDY